MALTAASDKVILAARPYLEFVKLFSTNLKQDSGEKYGGVVVQVLKGITETFDASSAGYNHASSSIAPATVTLGTHKKSTFQISDVAAIEDDLNPVWAQLAPVAGRALAKDVCKSITDLLTYTNREGDAITVSKSNLADFTAYRAFAEAKGLDPATCVLILESQTYAKLLSLIPYNVLGTDSALVAGKIAEFVGFKAVIDSPNISLNDAAATTKGIGFIVPEGAISVAARTVPAIKGVAGGLVEFNTFADEFSGFPFDQRVVVDANAGNCNWTVECLYGAALTKQSSNNAPGYYQLATA